MPEVDYQAEWRQHAQAPRAAFVVPRSVPNQVWQLDFTEYTTRMGGGRSPRPSGCSATPCSSASPITTGELRPVALVSDNGPCFKSARFAALIDKYPTDRHPHQTEQPGQNRVRERAFGSLKYEHLCRHEIDDGHPLGVEVERW